MKDLFMTLFVPAASIFYTISYSVIEGVREANYFHLLNISFNPTRDIPDSLKGPAQHRLYSMQRLIFFSVLFIINVEVLDLTSGVFLIMCYLSIFPLVHDSAYYIQRNNLDGRVYPKRWMDQSTTSSALSDTKYSPFSTFTRRGIIAALGIAGAILMMIYKL